MAEGEAAADAEQQRAAAGPAGAGGTASATIGASIGAGGQTAATSVGRETANQTFVTLIDAEQTKGRKDGGRLKNPYQTLTATTAGPRVLETHEALTQLALTLDQRLGALLSEHEKEFFLAYKTHMYSVQREIKALRMKAEVEEAKTRMDTTIKQLEVQLEWFMREAMRLDGLCKGYKKEVDKWKQRAEALDEDRRFLEDQIKGAKRQNKILRAAAERARSSCHSALMVTKARAEAEGGVGGLMALTAPPVGEAGRRPASATGGASTTKRVVGDARSKTPPELTSSSSTGKIPAAVSSTALAVTANHGPGPYPASSPASPLGQQRSASQGMIVSVLGADAEARYNDAIEHLKESIVKEQHVVRMLQASRASSYSQKSELEEFFLKCIDEARKDLMKKQHMTMYQEKDEREQVLEAMLKNEDVLVCLYEQLFPHRMGIARSLGAQDDAVDARALAQPLQDSGDRLGHSSGRGIRVGQ
eukprot:TRINITY_DN73596_c0_g1_i1.p1 TRINITY_DN73596_c0_g1~~TRINITY_DN73596_c0_g1_i1.p1  ORF type:complete len:476 (+),score=94.33 TRINITY_DN73596_c0_g1_i1:88-1515(+)